MAIKKNEDEFEINIYWVAKMDKSEIAINDFYDLMQFLEKYPNSVIESKIFMNRGDFYDSKKFRR